MRQLHDRFFRQAKREGHLARSFYKLEAIDQRFHLFRKGARVLDLGASPGSWTEYILSTVGDGGAVCAVDIQPIDKRFKDRVFFLLKDIRTVTPEDFAPKATRFDAIVSDMAPNTSGVKSADQARSLELCEAAAALAVRMLRPGGSFLCKIFEGPETKRFRDGLAAHFKSVKVTKPEACRSESKETYVLALGFRPSTGKST